MNSLLKFSGLWRAFFFLSCFIGVAHSARAAGRAYSWGDNELGQLGDGAITSNHAPAAVDMGGVLAGKTIIAIAAGGVHSLALSSDGKVYSWGDNRNGELGNGTITESSNAPVAVDMSGVLAGKTVTAISARGNYSLALSSDGKVYSWGYNYNGELGNGTTTESSKVPVAVDMNGVLAGKTVTAIAAGNSHSLALASDGHLYSWGDNYYGDLGNGTTTESHVPVAVNMSGVLAGKTITAIAAGGGYSLVLASDGHLYSWGANYQGRLGNGTTSDSNVPVAVDMSGVLAGKTVTAISAGDSCSLALSSDGKVYSWGYNFSGELGNGTTTESHVPVAVDMSGVLAGKTVTTVAAGGTHELALTPDGHIYGWGNNGNGQLGNGTTNGSNVPVAVDVSGALAGKTIIAIAAGSDHSLALSSDGKVYSWGYNNVEQLGKGATSNSAVPVAVDANGALAGKTIVAIAAGYSHSLSLASDGKVCSWGDNHYGQLGNGTTTDSIVPVAVDTSGALAGKTITAIAAGYYHSLALSSDGKVYSWGYNSDGQLGNGTTTGSNVPVAVDMTGVLAGKTVTAIYAGGYNCLVLTSDGHLYSWGDNEYGQLGNGTTTESHVPVAVDMTGVLAGKTVMAFTTSGGHNLVLASDGHLYSWGANVYGELGNGTTNNSSVPVAVDMTGVLAGKTITSIAAAAHSLVLDSAGRLYSWGTNFYGELGNGTTTESHVPVAVDMTGALADKTVIAISAGSEHDLSLASDGKVYSWGHNDYGKLGNGTMIDSSVPVAVDMNGVLAGKIVSAIAVGFDHSLALASDAVTPAASLVSVTANPASVTGGSASTGTVTLSAAAAANLTVTLSRNSAAATVPASVMVTTGHTSATFTINTSAASASTAVTIMASYSGVTKTAALTVLPPAQQVWRATDLAAGSDNLARLLWSRPDKAFAFWTLSASNAVTSTPLLGPIAGWNASAIGVAGDNKIRALISNTDGRAAAWMVQNATSGSITSTPAYGPISGFACREIAAAPNNMTRLLWVRSDGAFAVWTLDAGGNFTSTPLYGPIAGWSANAVSVGGDNKTTILLNHTDGRAAVWTVQDAASGNITSTSAYGPINGFSCRDIATGSDNKTRMLWQRTDGAFAVWTAVATSAANNFTSTPLYGPIAGWNGIKIGVGGDLKTRVLLTHTDGRAAVWALDNAGNITSTPAYGPIAAPNAAPPQSAPPVAVAHAMPMH